jgi:periplasmic divalent cation tolerance protein
VTLSTDPAALLALTTVSTRDEALRIARTLLAERLAACVNILPPMTSIYRWKGDVEEAQEQQLIIKTTTDRLPELQARLKALHPYETPELLVFTASGGLPEYLAWLRESARAGE